MATVTVTVNDVNDPPVANNDTYSVDEDDTLNVSAPGVLDNDSDPDSDPLTAVLVGGPSNGSLILNTDGSFIYTPAAGFNGTDSFTYKANDGTANSNVATVTVTVNASAPGPSSGVVYLPLVMDATPDIDLMPDLVVDRVIATGNSVQVTIKNLGGASIPPYHPSPAYAFRVDLYINPNQVPTGVNQTWQQCGAQGIVWSVPTSMLLGSGETTLTIGDAYYQASLSNFLGSLTAGTQVYAQVDSYNAANTYGTILERHEFFGGAYNNISGTTVQ